MKAEQKQSNPEHKNIFEAYAALQAELKPAIKSAENPYYKKKYADLHEINKTVKDPLANNGLIVTQTTQIEGEQIILKTSLIHMATSTEITSYYPVSYTTIDPQSIGSGLTYARRYQLACICGVVTEDDDGEGAMPRKSEQKPETKPKAVKSDAAVKKQIAKDLANCKNIQEVELYLESVPEELKTENFMKYVSQIKEAFNASV